MWQRKVGLCCAWQWDNARWVCAVHDNGTAQNGFVLCMTMGQRKVGLHCVWKWDGTRWVCTVCGNGTAQGGYKSIIYFKIKCVCVCERERERGGGGSGTEGERSRQTICRVLCLRITLCVRGLHDDGHWCSSNSGNAVVLHLQIRVTSVLPTVVLTDMGQWANKTAEGKAILNRIPLQRFVGQLNHV